MAERDRFELDLRAALRSYAEEAPTQVRPAELARRFAAAHPHPGPLVRPWRSAAIPRRAWTFLVLGALLATLVAGALVVGSQLQRKLPAVVPTMRPAPDAVALAPTGVDTLTSDPGAYGRTVVDGHGAIWARADGGLLVRFDPASGTARTWTSAEDAVFDTTDIAPAREGGVWLLHGRTTLVRFDGTAIRDRLSASWGIAVFAEAPDGTLWAASASGLVLHWDGVSWTGIEGGGKPDATAVVSAIAVDAAGGPWIGWSAPSSGVGSVARLDGSSWTVFDGEDSSLLGRSVGSVLPLPDGDVWVATIGGVARFDGTAWTDETAGLLAGSHAVAAGPDGTVWATDDRSIGAVARFDGQSWVYHGPPKGLPDGLRDGLVATQDGVFVTTGSGIFRLAGESWERAWPRASTARLNLLAALSRDELWARTAATTWPRHGDSGLWHLHDGSWTNEPIDPGLPTDGPDVMAVAPDGTLWAAGSAGSAGVAFRRDGRWTAVDLGQRARPPTTAGIVVSGGLEPDLQATAIAFDGQGAVYVGGRETWASLWGWVDGLWALRRQGASWTSRKIEGCPVSPESMAIDRTGALWVGSPTEGLARLDGETWESIQEPGGSGLDGANVLGVAPDGAVWIAAIDRSNGDDEVRLVRFDGKGWRVVDLPDHYRGDRWRGGGLTLAPDGTIWASTGSGAGRYDGAAWSFPAGAGTPVADTYVVAGDGTVFGQTPTGIVRFPTAVGAPTESPLP